MLTFSIFNGNQTESTRSWRGDPLHSCKSFSFFTWYGSFESWMVNFHHWDWCSLTNRANSREMFIFDRFSSSFTWRVFHISVHSTQMQSERIFFSHSTREKVSYVINIRLPHFNNYTSSSVITKCYKSAFLVGETHIKIFKLVSLMNSELLSRWNFHFNF